MNKRLGLIAGEGDLPRVSSANAIKEGYEVYAIAINRKAFFDLKGVYTKAIMIPPVKLGEYVKFGKENELKEILVVGKLSKLYAISQIPFLDELGKSYLKRLINFEDNVFHSVIKDIIQETGFEILPQSRFLKHFFLEKGLFSKRALTENEQKDLDYGIELAQKASSLEIGQTIVIKNQAIMAFEAAEGTDEAIKRGCKLAKKNAVIVKVPWERQFEFFDLPTVGTRTLRNIAKHKGSVLAVKAGHTFVIEPEKVSKLADELNVSFLAF